MQYECSVTIKEYLNEAVILYRHSRHSEGVDQRHELTDVTLNSKEMVSGIQGKSTTLTQQDCHKDWVIGEKKLLCSTNQHQQADT